MREIRFAAAQFEHRDGDKEYNLDRIRNLTLEAASRGADAVCFHECAVTGYTVLQRLGRNELLDWAEFVPDGPSTAFLIDLAKETGLIVMAGLVERDREDRIYNSYAAVGPEGLLAKHHKLHPFIHPALSPGADYTIFEAKGVKIGILTCYDNNLPENPRATTLLGAEVIVAPHVTGCTPSAMPGRGSVDRSLWENRVKDPSRLRLEFQGPKARGWLLRWLPARAWENGVYYVFSNPIGIDDDTIKPGLAMILDPHGEILDECPTLGDGLAVSTLTPDAYNNASGRRYLAARRPELYDRLTVPHPEGARPVTRPGWSLSFDDSKD